MMWDVSFMGHTLQQSNMATAKPRTWTIKFTGKSSVNWGSSMAMFYYQSQRVIRFNLTNVTKWDLSHELWEYMWFQRIEERKSGMVVFIPKYAGYLRKLPTKANLGDPRGIWGLRSAKELECRSKSSDVDQEIVSFYQDKWITLSSEDAFPTRTSSLVFDQPPGAWSKSCQPRMNHHQVYCLLGWPEIKS